MSPEISVQLSGADAVRARGRPRCVARTGKGDADPARSETWACSDASYAGIGRARIRLPGSNPLEQSSADRVGKDVAVADDARSLAVGPLHSSDEGSEQTGLTGAEEQEGRRRRKGNAIRVLAYAGRRAGRPCAVSRMADGTAGAAMTRARSRMLLNPLVRICAGGGPQGPSLPRPAIFNACTQ